MWPCYVLCDAWYGSGGIACRCLAHMPSPHHFRSFCPRKMWGVFQPSVAKACVTPDELPAGASLSSRGSSRELERAFRARLQPDVAWWTIIYYSVVVLLLAASFACEVILPNGSVDAHEEPLAVVGGTMLAHLVLWVVVSAAWWADRGCRLPWDAMSVCVAAVVCMAHPWIDAWGGPGRLADRVAERSLVFRTAALSVGFAAYVPVASSHLLVVPLCSIASYALLLGTFGATDARDLPVLLGTLCLPLLSLGGNLRRRELCEKAAWLAELAARERPETPDDADFAFVVSEGCCLLRTNSEMHDGLLGRKAEGFCLASLLPPAERVRLQDLLDEVETTSAARTLEPCTLRLPRGHVRASLRVAPLEHSREGHDGASFRIGLRIVQDSAQKQGEEEKQHQPFREEIRRPSFAGAGERSESLHERPEVWPFEAAVPVPTSSSFRRTRSQKASLYGGISEFGEGTQSLSLHRVPSWLMSDDGTLDFSESTGRPSRPVTTASECTQTTAPRRVDVGVSTSIVMDGFSFRCAACCRPPAPPLYSPDGSAPVVPGPRAHALIAKLDRQKGVRRSRSPSPPLASPRRNSEPAVVPGPSEEALQSYKGHAFDGTWEVRPDDAPTCSAWLRRFHISAGRVVLNDGTRTKLTQRGAHGPVQLCHGEVVVQSGGRLLRRGRSGRVFEFVQVGQQEAPFESEPAEDAASSGRRLTK